MKAIPVAPKVWRISLPTPFAVGSVNVYVIKDQCVTLVDAGPNTEEAQLILEKAFKELTLTFDDIDQIVMTHHHPDHMGGLAYLPKNIPVIGHELLEPWLGQDPIFLTNYDNFFKQFSLKMGVPIEIIDRIPGVKKYLRFSAKRNQSTIVHEGDQLEGLPGWTIIETPGHAENHIGLIRKRDGLYLAGDHLLPHISSNPLFELPYRSEGEQPKPFLKYLESLKKLLEVEFQTVLPGHGEPFSNGHELIRRRLKEQTERGNKILEFLHLQKMTAFELGRVMFPKAYLKQLDFVLSEVAGFLDWLVTRNEVEYELKGHYLLFQSKKA